MTSGQAQPGVASPGFFGKIPARGDFVARRLDHAFRTGFDTWLQRSIDVSRRQLGQAWLPAYLNAPLGRCIGGPGRCGPEAALGVMMPSVDRVGRYFPLVLAAQLPDCLSPVSMFRSARPWFEAAEQLILTSLDDGFDFDVFDRETQAIGIPDYPHCGEGKRPVSMRLTLPDDADPADTYAQILDQVVVGTEARFSLWWTLGSEQVDASLLIGAGLPSPTSFTAFLDGQWSQWGWERPRDGATAIDSFPVLLLRPVEALACAGRTHPGTVRRVNEDALLMRPDLGIRAVADGVGGHEAGDWASQTVIEHLGHMPPPLSFGGAAGDVREVLEEANRALLARAATIGEDAVVASTASVLLVYAGHYAVLWSGDSRAYRLRDGALSCLSRDHVRSGLLLHGVGVDAQLTLDVELAEAKPGDRFLLCSDGVTKVLSDEDLRHALTDAPRPEHAAAALIEEALVVGASDNVTAVIVDVPRER